MFHQRRAHRRPIGELPAKRINQQETPYDRLYEKQPPHFVWQDVPANREGHQRCAHRRPIGGLPAKRINQSMQSIDRLHGIKSPHVVKDTIDAPTAA